MVRFSEPLQRDTVEQPVEISEPPPVKRLDGKVTRNGELAFARGTYCDVWVGLWDKGGREEVGSEKVDPEKVSLSFTTSTLLTLPLQVALKALRALTSPERSYGVRLCGSSPRCLLTFLSTIKASGRARKVRPWPAVFVLFAHVSFHVH